MRERKKERESARERERERLVSCVFIQLLDTRRGRLEVIDRIVLS